jgi:hypothetical protein
MSRRTRWILLVLVVVVIGGAVALTLSERPKLDDARSAVDTKWKPLRAPDQLVVRYQKLEGALSAFDAAGGSDRSVSKDLHAALDAWNRALKSGGAGAQAETANVVEAQATRLAANALGSERLKSNPAVTDSLLQFSTTQIDPALVAAYNRAVRAYEDERTGTLARPVARVLGYDARPLLVLSGKST